MNPHELSPPLLTAALQRIGVLRESSVVAVEADRIGQDLGFNGVLWRVIPTYNCPEPQAPSSLIAKFVQHSADAEKLAKEARFYREFGGRIGIRFPRAYVAEPELLLLEDLAPLACGDVAAGCSGGEARMIARHLARLHAFGWKNPEITGHDWLPRWPTNPDRFHARFRQFHPVFFERFGPLVDDAMRDLTARLVEAIPLVIERLRQAPPTLIHVDLHLDNLFYELPETVVLIDWPSAAVGPAAVDLARFVATCLDSPVRRTVEDALLSDYLRALQEAGITDYDLEALWRDLKLIALRSWAGMVTGFAASNPTGLLERQAALQRIEINRMTAAASDWQLAEVLDAM